MRSLSVLPLVVYQAEQRTNHRIPYSNIVLLKWIIAEGYGNRRIWNIVSGHGKMAGES
ncbi:hypothetical protein ACNKHV_00755 [Shigella flexneri]